MPDSYTYIPKPTGAPYSYVNFEGKQTYDDPNIIYDDSTVYYDSFSPFSWTEVSKPSDGSATIRAGMATGLIMPLTYSQNYNINVSKWTQVPKPS